MEVDTLATTVGEIIQDETYGAAWIIGKFNECLLLAATLCRIPGLQTSKPVTAEAGAARVQVPSNYLRDLFHIKTAAYPQGIVIAPNIKELKACIRPDETGAIQIACLDGKYLHLGPIPEAGETLELHYYRKPEELIAGGEFPNYLPEIFQKELYQNYALKEAYMLIEDGVDGKIPNTQKYSGAFSAALGALEAFYPNAPKARPNIRRAWSDF